MKLLVGIVAYGTSKDYVMPKFLEMLEACVLPLEPELLWV